MSSLVLLFFVCFFSWLPPSWAANSAFPSTIKWSHQQSATVVHEPERSQAPGGDPHFLVLLWCSFYVVRLCTPTRGFHIILAHAFLLITKSSAEMIPFEVSKKYLRPMPRRINKAFQLWRRQSVSSGSKMLDADINTKMTHSNLPSFEAEISWCFYMIMVQNV